MNKIKEIILNENYTNFDKLILIFKEVDKTKGGLKELSEIVNIPVILLNDYMPVVIIEKESKNNFQEYAKAFYKMYEFTYEGLKYDPSNKGKEFGSLKNISKKVNLKQWKNILKWVSHYCKKYNEDKKSVDFYWKIVCAKVSPSIINSQFDFIKKEILLKEKAKGKGKFEGFRNDVKKK